jgi:hypothetical protein
LTICTISSTIIKNKTSRRSLKMYVKHSGKSWQKTNDFGAYSLTDLDQILISYGNESEDQINWQMSQVTDRACIQSEKCPERGSPHDESTCAGTGPCKA